jgi:hypothetical protein
MKRFLYTTTLTVFLIILTGFVVVTNSQSQTASETELSLIVENNLINTIKEDINNPGMPIYSGINITKANGQSFPKRTKPPGFNNFNGSFGSTLPGSNIQIAIQGLQWNGIPALDEKCRIALFDSSGVLLTNSFASSQGMAGNISEGEGLISESDQQNEYKCVFTGFLGSDFIIQNNITARFIFD